MKRVDWPRPPLLLGLVLGGLLERYMFISFQRYGTDWLSRPIVIGVFLVTAYSLLKPIVSDLLLRRREAASKLTIAFKHNSIDSAVWFNVAVIAFFLTAIVGSWQWDFGARLVPQVVGWLGLSLASWQLGWTFFVTTEAVHPTGALEKAEAETQTLGSGSELSNLSAEETKRRALRYFGWCFFILISALLVGLLPAMLIFLVGYLRIEAKEGWKTTLAVSLGVWVIA